MAQQVTASVRLPEDVVERIQEVAAADDRTPSYVLRKLVQAGLAQLEANGETTGREPELAGSK